MVPPSCLFSHPRAICRDLPYHLSARHERTRSCAARHWRTNCCRCQCRPSSPLAPLSSELGWNNISSNGNTRAKMMSILFSKNKASCRYSASYSLLSAVPIDSALVANQIVHAAQPFVQILLSCVEVRCQTVVLLVTIVNCLLQKSPQAVGLL